MDAACRVLFQKGLDRRSLAQRVQKFDLGVRQFDEHHRHAMIRLVLRRAHLSAQRIAVLRHCGSKIRHGNGDDVSRR